MTEKFKEYALRLKNQKLFETEEIYQKHLAEFAPSFQDNFQQICENIVRLQQARALGEISYLEYTFLYTNLMQKNETAEVRVYNDQWYFDSLQCAAGSFDFSCMFSKYRELWLELMDSRKRFAGAVTAQEASSFLLACARPFFKYAAAACRFSILPCVERVPFLFIQRGEQFEINIGEYMAHTEAVYKENRRRTSADALAWFSQRLEFAYAFEDFTDLDFSGADLSEIDLRYSDLRRAKLIGTDFQDAMLFGTRFCHARMEGADLRYCLMHEADFTGASLVNARFSAAEAFSGISGRREWSRTGYRSVCFKDADLTNADFTGTKIRDADFTGAVMDGTVIQKSQLERFALSEQQRQAVRLTDG